MTRTLIRYADIRDARRQLQHWIAGGGPAEEFPTAERVRVGGRLWTEEIWYADPPANTVRLYDVAILEGGAVLPTKVRYRVYGADGAVRAQAIETITRAGAVEVSRRREVTVYAG